MKTQKDGWISRQGIWIDESKMEVIIDDASPTHCHSGHSPTREPWSGLVSSNNVLAAHHHALAGAHSAVVVVVVAARRRHATLMLLRMMLARRCGAASRCGSAGLDHVGGDLVEGGDAVCELAEDRCRQRVSRVRQGGRDGVVCVHRGRVDAVRQGNANRTWGEARRERAFGEMENGKKVKQA